MRPQTLERDLGFGVSGVGFRVKRWKGTLALGFRVQDVNRMKFFHG